MTSKVQYSFLLLVFLCGFSASDQQDGNVSVGYGYTVQSVSNGEPSSMVATLQLINETSVYGPDVEQLSLTASFETESRLRVRVTDVKNPRWEIPNEVVQRPPPINGSSLSPVSAQSSYQLSLNNSDMIFTLHNTTPFGFTVSRRSTNETLFDAVPSQGKNLTYLIFKDQYIQLSSSLPLNTSNIYGLGEHTKSTFRLLPNQTSTLWNSDTPSVSTDVNLYGSHPFYLDVRSPKGNSHGVLLFNSNGMDIEYTGDRIIYRVIGGIMDLYFFAGPSPVSVVQQYTELIGRPALMPNWAFGFHQCRYGYKNVDDLENVTANYKKANIPLETMWTDIDYMDAYKDFTFDPVNFPLERMQKFVDTLHNNSQKYVVIVDPGIAVNESYDPYTRGLKADIYITRNGSNYVGKVWPGNTTFPDFFNPDAFSYWKNEIELFRDLLPVDGLWIDMNEIANFITSSDNVTADLDSPPYKINAGGNRHSINERTVPPSALHFGNITEYNVHNLFGLMESIATHGALVNVTGERPFVLSRSTFPGTGKYAAHWTGDNGARWNDLAYSIPSILNSGIFGIPMVGADICGFLDDTNEELCRRWIQLGAFYPFSRDHSNKNGNRRELYLWDSVAQSARKVLALRYKLLPYLYTLNNEAHTNGTPIARPLFFSFPDDPNTYGVYTQFLLGKGVLISPVLQSGSNSVEAYFPAGNWFDLFNKPSPLKVPNGKNITLDAPDDHINVYALEGTVIPMQGQAMTTEEARKTPFHLWVALSSSKNSTGELFVDNGKDLHTGGEGGNWTFVKLNGALVGNNVVVESEVVNGQFASSQNWIIDRISVHGLSTTDYNKMMTTRNRKLLNVKVEQVQNGFVSLEASKLSVPVGKNFRVQIAPTLKVVVF